MHTEYVNWSGKKICLSDIGFSLEVPQHAIPHGDPVKISICALMKCPFTLPTGLELVSPVCFVTITPDIVFTKKVMLSLDHWGRLDKDSNLVFVFAPFDRKNPQTPLQFEAQEHGIISQHCVTILTRHFCGVAVARFLLPIPLPVPLEKTSRETDGNLISRFSNCYEIFTLFCYLFVVGEGEGKQPQKTTYHYLASFFYPLFTFSHVKPATWVYVVAISLNHPIFPNVSAVQGL